MIAPNFATIHQTRLDMLETLHNNAVCAELGVFSGAFSREILRICQPEKLYLVDLFYGDIQSGDQDGKNMRWENMESMQGKLVSEFASAPVVVSKSDSSEWLNNCDPGLLSWVYLDTSHTFEQTQRELNAAMRAVKVGGFIAGHDFHRRWYEGLVEAVTEFVLRYGMRCEIFNGDLLPSFKITNSPNSGL